MRVKKWIQLWDGRFKLESASLQETSNFKPFT
jgi:hypothetical protein